MNNPITLNSTISRTVDPITGEVTYAPGIDEGLVPSAISRHDVDGLPTIEVYADIFVVKHPVKLRFEHEKLCHPTEAQHKTPSKRGTVQGFSAKSRARLLRETAKMREFFTANKPTFITLTYPGKDVITHTNKKWGRDIDVFRKRLYRWFEEKGLQSPSALWRKEFKPRKTGELEGTILPHLHIVLFAGVPYQKLVALGFVQFVKVAWWETVGSNDADHLKAGARVEELIDKSRTRLYVSKYICKVEEDLNFDTGRCWGIWGQVDKSQSITVTITEKQFLRVRRFFRKWLKKRGKRFYAQVLGGRCVGFSLLGVGDANNPDFYGLAMRAIMNLDRL